MYHIMIISDIRGLLSHPPPIFLYLSSRFPPRAEFKTREREGSFNDWLVQLSPEDITRAIMSSKQGTGIWRELWDSVPPGTAYLRPVPPRRTGGGGTRRSEED